MNDDYYCVLSGLAPQSTGIDEGDDFEDMPNGWIKVIIQRRVENPQWQLVQEIKNESLKQMLSQVPEEQHGMVIDAIKLQIDAQYVALEDRLGQYIVAEETRYISDPAENQAVFDECKSLFEKLELDFEDLGIDNSENDDKVEEPKEEPKESSDK
jgi:hypothetical protein